jgi:ubiquitin C-terminal hydrolase
LDQAEDQSPKRSPFAGMGAISFSAKKRTKPSSIESPLSPIRARPLLTSSPAVSPAAQTSAAPHLKKWVGLRNLGNTCYINASLQMLYSIPSFVEELFPFRPGHRLVNMFCQTYQNVLHPKEGFEGSASARALKMAVDAKTDKFQGYQQRDAHEFLGDLIDQVHQEIEHDSSKDNGEEEKEEEKKDDGLSSRSPISKAPVLPTDDFFRLNVEVCLECKSWGYSR